MTTLSVYDRVRAGAQLLQSEGIETAALDAELLMRHLLNQDRAHYFMHRREPFQDSLEEMYTRLLSERANRVPVAYLIGKREFLGMEFVVGPGALVPRPETELLVEWAVSWLQGKRDMIAVDVGTGSGAIAIGVAQLAEPGSLRGVIAVEPSNEAIRWARQNIAMLDTAHLVSLVRGNLLDPIVSADLVLANLPYLTPEQLAENGDLSAEPPAALVSGDDGLDLIRVLVADLPRVLTPEGAAILELDPAQAVPVLHLARASFPSATVAVVNDLAGLARFVTIKIRR